MGTFRSRRAHRGPDDRLGAADVPHPDDLVLIAAASDATVVIPRRQRPAATDRALLPVWLYRLLIAGMFAVIYALTGFGLFMIVMILVS